MKFAKAVTVISVGAMLLGTSACSVGGTNARTATVDPSGDGVLRVGALLDNSGPTAFLNASETAGIKLALNQINAVGGLKGKQVELVQGGSSGDAAAQARALVNSHADAVIGPTDSANAQAAIDVLSKSTIPLISPANMAAGLSTYNSGGYYFRTQPADTMESSVLATLAKKAGTKVAVLSEDSSYGSELGGAVVTALGNAGATVVSHETVASGKAADAVGKVKSTSPDAVVVVARSAAQGIIAELANAGIPGSKIVLADGATANYGTAVPSEALKDSLGVIPGLYPSSEFQAQILGVDASLKDLTYAAESYDATNLAALAAAAADDDGGASIASKLITVSGGKVQGQEKGTACHTFPECVGLLKEKKNIDYQGQSGPVDFDANGDVTGANYSIMKFGADNKPGLNGTDTSFR